MTAPLFLVLGVFASVLLGQLAVRPSTSRVARRWQQFAAACLVLQFVWIGWWSKEVRGQRVGLVSVSREYPAFVGMIASIPKQARIYSNWPHVVQYLTGHVAVGLPWLQSMKTFEPNLSLGTELEDVGRVVGSQDTYLVMFDAAGVYPVAGEPYLARYVRIDSLRTAPGGRIARLLPR